jgi:hypothetical protein
MQSAIRLDQNHRTTFSPDELAGTFSLDGKRGVRRPQVDPLRYFQKNRKHPFFFLVPAKSDPVSCKPLFAVPDSLGHNDDPASLATDDDRLGVRRVKSGEPFWHYCIDP